MKSLLVRSTLVLCLVSLFASCSHSVSGNEGGSQPVNDQEETLYKRAVHKCYKSGGSRVVKIGGELRCYD